MSMTVMDEKLPPNFLFLVFGTKFIESRPIVSTNSEIMFPATVVVLVVRWWSGQQKTRKEDPDPLLASSFAWTVQRGRNFYLRNSRVFFTVETKAERSETMKCV